jgi:hypothetical protein
LKLLEPKKVAPNAKSCTKVAETSFKKVLASHELWLTLDGEQQEIAAKSNGILKGIRAPKRCRFRFCITTVTATQNLQTLPI